MWADDDLARPGTLAVTPTRDLVTVSSLPGGPILLIDTPLVCLLTVAATGTGSGSVTATGISCGADCLEPYADGAVVTLTATPAAGSMHAGWSGCDNPSGNQCTMTRGADKTVTASFDLLPQGGGSPAPPAAPAATPGVTGQRAAALKQCKKKQGKARKKCKRRALKLPV